VQYSILTQNPHFKAVVSWLDQHGQWFEVHLNRTRFTLEPGVITTEFMLRYSEYVCSVDPSLDLATGLPQYDYSDTAYTHTSDRNCVSSHGPAVLI
jgi:hypothetical protein